MHNVPRHSETHFKVVIVAECFNGLSLLKVILTSIIWYVILTSIIWYVILTSIIWYVILTSIIYNVCNTERAAMVVLRPVTRLFYRGF